MSASSTLRSMNMILFGQRVSANLVMVVEKMQRSSWVVHGISSMTSVHTKEPQRRNTDRRGPQEGGAVVQPQARNRQAPDSGTETRNISQPSEPLEGAWPPQTA